MSTHLRRAAIGLVLSVCTACSDRDGAEAWAQQASSADGLPVVVTDAPAVDPIHARIPVRVVDPGEGLYECGYCWGPDNNWDGVNFVDSYALGPRGQRCVRQIPCRNGAYYTNDGFMAPAYYGGGLLYYRAYARNARGIGYGEMHILNVPGVSTEPYYTALTYFDHAWLLGTLRNVGSRSVSECGICWGSATNPSLVEQSDNTPGNSVRCMRAFGCTVNRYGDRFQFTTRDGYQAPIDYHPDEAVSQRYRAYAILDGQLVYGKTESLPPPSVFLYVTAGVHNGDFRAYGEGRSGLDAFCRNSVPRNLSCGSVAAVINASSSEHLARMPDAPIHMRSAWIRRADGAYLSPYWTYALENGHFSPIDPSPKRYWTGADLRGAPSRTCNGWTSSTGVGATGLSTATVSTQVPVGWFSQSEIDCSTELPLLCACW